MQRPKGFTLIELLIIIAIAGLLAAVAIPRFGDTVLNTKINTARAEIQALAVALRSFHMDCAQYPSLADPTTGYLDNNEEWQSVLVDRNQDYLLSANEKTYWGGPYLTKAKLDPWGNPYLFIDYDANPLMVTAVVCLGPDGNRQMEFTNAYKKTHPGSWKDNIAICYENDDPADKKNFDIVYWMK